MRAHSPQPQIGRISREEVGGRAAEEIFHVPCRGLAFNERGVAHDGFVERDSRLDPTDEVFTQSAVSSFQRGLTIGTVADQLPDH